MTVRIWLAAALMVLGLSLGACGDGKGDERPGTEATGGTGGSDEGTGGTGGSDEGTGGTGGSDEGTGGTGGSDEGTGGTGGSDEGTGGTGGSEPLPELASLWIQAEDPKACEPFCDNLFEGERLALVAVGMDFDEEEHLGVPVSWSSSDPAVATVDEAGLLTAVADGQAIIEAQYEAFVAAFSVTVGREEVTSLDVGFSFDEMKLAAGNEVTISAQAYQSSGFIRTPVRAEIEFVSADPAVATIEAHTRVNGYPAVVVRAAAEGQTTLTVSSPQGVEGHEKELTLTVLPATIPGATWQTEAIATGYSVACALDAGQAHCWGEGLFGGLGNGTYDSMSPVPVPVSGGHGFTQIEAGDGFVCALEASGATWCWGANAFGILGAPDDVFDSNVPLELTGAPVFAELRAGTLHACGLTAEGRAHCWGSNRGGALGTGSAGDPSRTPIPMAGDHTFVDLALGANFGCGLDTAGQVWCWGQNSPALGLGDELPFENPTPQALDLETTFQAIAASTRHVCALDATGAAWCWGDGERGQLGVPSDNEFSFRLSTPTKLAGEQRFASIYAGDEHSCALDAQGKAWCWGENADGRLGTGDLVSSHVPREVIGGLSFVELSLRKSTTCGRTGDGSTYCWGSSEFGWLGDGSAATYRPIPGPVSAPAAGGEE